MFFVSNAKIPGCQTGCLESSSPLMVGLSTPLLMTCQWKFQGWSLDKNPRDPKPLYAFPVTLLRVECTCCRVLACLSNCWLILCKNPNLQTRLGWFQAATSPCNRCPPIGPPAWCDVWMPPSHSFVGQDHGMKRGLWQTGTGEWICCLWQKIGICSYFISHVHKPMKCYYLGIMSCVWLAIV